MCIVFIINNKTAKMNDDTGICWWGMGETKTNQLTCKHFHKLMSFFTGMVK